MAGSSDTFQDVVINPTSKTAYLTVQSKNQVDVLNLKKGTFAKPIPVGSDPLGIDITPDGKTLYVVSGSLNTFISSSALSGDGSTLLIDGTYVINPATGSLLGTISGPGGSSVLNAPGTTGTPCRAARSRN